MADTPLVSVTIPTYNSARTLDATLAAVAGQTYPRVEVIVVDSHSDDATAAIAEKYGAKVVQIGGRLLQARHQGTLASGGEYVLLLDSDQILEPTTLQRAVDMMRQGTLDMLFLEEHSYRPQTWLQRLFELDRRHIQSSAMMDAATGVMLPRFFRRDVLVQAFTAMPVDDLAEVVAQDHAIIHWEVSKVSQRGAMLPHAVYHMDPGDVVYLLKHFYKKGRAARKLDRNRTYATRYRAMFHAKSRSRGFGTGGDSFALASNLVLLLKGVPYVLGRWLG